MASPSNVAPVTVSFSNPALWIFRQDSYLALRAMKNPSILCN